MLYENELSYQIIGAAIEVHRELGPGLLESAYEECLCYELKQRGIAFQRQLLMPMNYKDAVVREGMYRLDVFVQETVVVDVKSCERLHPVYKKQVFTYLQQTRTKLGLLLNFNVPVMRDGIVRVARGLEEETNKNLK